jgi:general nucleoside transport system permease protein
MVFSQWNPIDCIHASLLFGATGGSDVVADGGNHLGYSLFRAAPYIVTLVVLIITARVASRPMRGMPGQLSIGR